MPTLSFIQNQPLNADFASVPQQLPDGSIYSIQLAFTGSPCSFTTSLQTSSEPPTAAHVPTPMNFDPIPNSSQSITEAGTFTYNVGLVGYNYVQLLIVDDSGGTNSGTVSANIVIKNN